MEWYSGETNIITVTADPSVELKAFYRLVSSSDDFEELSGEFIFVSGRTHMFSTAISVNGDYIVEVENVTQGGRSSKHIRVITDTQDSTAEFNIVSDKITELQTRISELTNTQSFTVYT